MYAFLDQHRADYGVEPICRVLEIAPSAYRAYAAQQRDPGKRSPRRQREAVLRPQVHAAFEASGRRYGARKIERQLRRDGVRVARCTVERLMRDAGLRGVVRGRRVRTTTADVAAPRPLDLVQRQFRATRPNELWVADFTYVATWRGMVYVAFVIDVFSRRIVGWRASASMRTDLALDALEQAVWDRRPTDRLVHHSDRGVQYLAIRYTERLADAGIEASVGSRGDSYDNALAETVIGLYKAEVIFHAGPWRGLEQVELATLDWVHWFNTERLLAPLGYVPPAEFEEQYARQQDPQATPVAA